MDPSGLLKISDLDLRQETAKLQKSYNKVTWVESGLLLNNKGSMHLPHTMLRLQVAFEVGEVAYQDKEQSKVSVGAASAGAS